MLGRNQSKQERFARAGGGRVVQQGIIAALLLVSVVGRADNGVLTLKRLYKKSLPTLPKEALLAETFHSKTQGDIANHPYLDMQQYKEIRRAAVDLLQRYPGHLVVTPGRSMTQLAAFLQNLHPNAATNVPLSGLRKYTPEAQQMDAHLDVYLGPVIQQHPGQPLVVVDRSSKGGSIIKTQQLIAGWLQRRGDNRRVDILSFDRHPERNLPRYEIKNITSFETPQLFEEFSQYKHFVVGRDTNPGNRKKYRTLRKAMRERMGRDRTLHRQLKKLGRIPSRKK